jgi:hypothetical protein
MDSRSRLAAAIAWLIARPIVAWLDNEAAEGAHFRFWRDALDGGNAI